MKTINKKSSKSWYDLHKDVRKKLQSNMTPEKMRAARRKSYFKKRSPGQVLSGILARMKKPQLFKDLAKDVDISKLMNSK